MGAPVIHIELSLKSFLTDIDFASWTQESSDFDGLGVLVRTSGANNGLFDVSERANLALFRLRIQVEALSERFQRTLMGSGRRFRANRAFRRSLGFPAVQIRAGLRARSGLRNCASRGADVAHLRYIRPDFVPIGVYWSKSKRLRVPQNADRTATETSDAAFRGPPAGNWAGLSSASRCDAPIDPILWTEVRISGPNPTFRSGPASHARRYRLMAWHSPANACARTSHTDRAAVGRTETRQEPHLSNGSTNMAVAVHHPSRLGTHDMTQSLIKSNGC